MIFALFLAALVVGAVGFFIWYTLTPMALTPTDMPYPPR